MESVTHDIRRGVNQDISSIPSNRKVIIQNTKHLINYSGLIPLFPSWWRGDEQKRAKCKKPLPRPRSDWFFGFYLGCIDLHNIYYI